MVINGISHRRVRVCLIAIALLLVAGSAQAQLRTTRTLQFGVGVSGVLGTSSAEFSALPGVANCIGSLGASTMFDGGSGGGFAVNALAGLTPVPGMAGGFLSHIGLDLGVGYASTSTSFEVDERIGDASDPVGDIVPVFSRYTIDTKISELRLEPTARYFIGPDLPLTLGLGAKFGFLMKAAYDQKETIASPSGATYADGSTERNTTSGDLADANSLQVGVKLGVAYDVTLSQTLSLRPEIAGVLGLTSPVNGVTWNPNEVRFGVSLLFTPAPQMSTPLESTGEGNE